MAKNRCLWMVVCPSGNLHGVKMITGDWCLPCFTTHVKAQCWIEGIGLENHFLTPPLFGLDLLDTVEACRESGFSTWTLNPPASLKMPCQTSHIDYLVYQAEVKAGVADVTP